MGEQIQFSEREKQVIDLLILVRSNKQIALVLGVSVRTVEFHLSNIYTKLGVSSRTEAALKLSKTQLRESTGETLRESAIHEMDKSDDNVDKSKSTRRTPMNKSFFARLVLLILIAVICIVAMVIMATQRESGQEVAPESRSVPTSILIIPTLTSKHMVSSID
jgi:DNA-binding CsgD family transcriptional regulator